MLRELDRVGITELQPTPDVTDVRVAGSHTAALPGLLIVRFNGPLYTANVRSANRKLLAAAEAARPQVMVLDASAVGMLSATALGEFGELERGLGERGVELWIASLPPRSLATARKTPRWVEVEAAGRVFPTSLAAAQAYRERGSVRSGSDGTA